MVSVRGAFCQHEGCSSRASYGERADMKSIRCVPHKGDLKDPVSTAYILCKCGENAHYAMENHKKATHCGNCKTDDMVRKGTDYNRCNNENCRVTAIFGYKKREPMRCKDHKEKDMVDVLNKNCEYEGCLKQGGFKCNTDDGIKTFCDSHRTNEFKRTKTAKCIIDNCIKFPYWGVPEKSYSLLFTP